MAATENLKSRQYSRFGGNYSEGTRVWDVDGTQATASFDGDLPEIGDAFPDVGGATPPRLRKLGTQYLTPSLTRVTGHYTSNTSSTAGGVVGDVGGNSSVTVQSFVRPRLMWFELGADGTEETSKPLNGPFGQYIDMPAKRVIIGRRITGWSQSRTDAFVGKTNDRTFSGATKDKVLFNGFSGDEVNPGVWDVHFEFVYDPLGWDDVRAVLNKAAGNYKLSRVVATHGRANLSNIGTTFGIPIANKGYWAISGNFLGQ